MYQRDYLLRIIEQLTAVMMRVVLQIEAKNYAKALIEIELAYQTLLRVDPSRIQQMTTDELIDWLQSDGRFDVEKSLVIAELLREEAKIRELESGFDDSIFELLIKSFYLYVETMMNDGRFDLHEYADKIDSVVQKIIKYELPLNVQSKLFQYYEQSGSFDKAEDILHELVNQQYPNTLAEGTAFYTRLLDKSDADLLAGNLPRDEVKDGLVQLRGRLTAKISVEAPAS